jgi:hypothetical protein
MMQQACRVGIAGPAGVFRALTQPADNRPQSLNGYVIWRLQDFNTQGPSHTLSWDLSSKSVLDALMLERQYEV